MHALVLLVALGGTVERRVSEDVIETRQSVNADGTETWVRRIDKDVNYRDENGNLHTTSDTLEAAADPGDLPDGALSYGEQQRRAPAQCYLVNNDDVDNSTRYLCRKAKNKNHWFRFQAANADPNFNTGVAGSVDRPNRKLNWIDLWSTGAPNPRKANLIYFMRRTGVESVVRIKGVNAPHSFQFRVRLPVGWTLALNGDALEIRDGAATPQFTFAPPMAWDSPGGIVELRAPALGANTYAANYAIVANGTTGDGFPWYRFSATITGDTSAAEFPVVLR